MRRCCLLRPPTGYGQRGSSYENPAPSPLRPAAGLVHPAVISNQGSARSASVPRYEYATSPGRLRWYRTACPSGLSGEKPLDASAWLVSWLKSERVDLLATSTSDEGEQQGTGCAAFPPFPSSRARFRFLLLALRIFLFLARLFFFFCRPHIEFPHWLPVFVFDFVALSLRRISLHSCPPHRLFRPPRAPGRRQPKKQVTSYIPRLTAPNAGRVPQ